MINKMEVVRLKEKMAGIVNRWKDKETLQGSVDWPRRRADRSLYALLKRKLEKLEGRQSTIDLAKEIFSKEID